MDDATKYTILIAVNFARILGYIICLAAGVVALMKKSKILGISLVFLGIPGIYSLVMFFTPGAESWLDQHSTAFLTFHDLITTVGFILMLVHVIKQERC